MKKNAVINSKSSQPIYKQLVQSVISGIEKGYFAKGQQLPSIKKFAAASNIVKETVAKAYYELRELGIIIARHGEGYYVSKTKAKIGLNIFVLFDTLKAYKEVLYTALKNALPVYTKFSIFFHHYNIKQFAKLIKENPGSFNYCVIMPHFDKDVSAIVNAIPMDKLLMPDKDMPKLKNEYVAVFQDFENDIYNDFVAGLHLIKNYIKLHLAAGYEYLQYVPSAVIKGYERFCTTNSL